MPITEIRARNKDKIPTNENRWKIMMLSQHNFFWEDKEIWSRLNSTKNLFSTFKRFISDSMKEKLKDTIAPKEGKTFDTTDGKVDCHSSDDEEVWSCVDESGNEELYYSEPDTLDIRKDYGRDVQEVDVQRDYGRVKSIAIETGKIGVISAVKVINPAFPAEAIEV